MDMTPEISAKLFDSVSDMEPLLPSVMVLQNKAAEIWRSAAELGGVFPKKTLQEIAGIVRSMNGYYSNLIEGHTTRPIEIEAALRKSFSTDNGERNRQMLHLAHLETLEEAEKELSSSTAMGICSKEYLCKLHYSFCSRLPKELLVTKDPSGSEFETIPGEFRTSMVAVGRHIAPLPGKLNDFLKRFEEAYTPLVLDQPDSLVVAAAAHHRLAWIHPFSDGNGRVSRMFTHLWFIKAGAGGHGLWTLSRGLARGIDEYKTLLDAADEKRHGDLDGRGYLSLSSLDRFCSFIMDTSMDQISFMKGMLSLPGLNNRIRGFCDVRERSGELPKRTSLLLPEIVLKGDVSRGDVSRLVGASPRTAQALIGNLLELGYLKSDSPKGKLSIGFPVEACSHFFPDLFPSGPTAPRL
jgi:Fic family protein